MSAMVTVALSDPVAWGENVTNTVHVAVAAKFPPEYGQALVPEARAKLAELAPPTAMLEMARGEVPVLVRVTL